MVAENLVNKWLNSRQQPKPLALILAQSLQRTAEGKVVSSKSSRRDPALIEARWDNLRHRGRADGKEQSTRLLPLPVLTPLFTQKAQGE